MLQLQTKKRDSFGKAVEDLRQEGFIPAELYGHGKENIHLSLPEKDFMKILRNAGESSVIEVLVESEKHPVLIHDVQMDTIHDRVLHVDFYEVRMDEKVRTEVPIEFVGEAPAVKAYGGVLIKALEKIEVEALPADLPPHIEVDLSGLAELNQSVYVRDLPIPSNVKIFADPETPVASITEQQAEETVETPPASEVPVEGETAAPAESESAEQK